MKSRARRMLFTGVIGVVSVALGVSAFGVAMADPGPVEEDNPPSGVETFEYPNAAAILKERNIVLRKGDGHILLADCGVTKDIVISTSKVLPGQTPEGQYCFKVTGTGKTGYLALEVPETYNVYAGAAPVRATATVGDQVEIVDVPKKKMKAVGEGHAGQDDKTAILVELRLIG
ncbi:hypothetical protein [Streptomyces sp. NPDC021096]|uniref:hypothetical protein n=1 Tax=Streptomyces sp. NPDC021096 TaxID=3154792 RepID=UPI0033C92199